MRPTGGFTSVTGLAGVCSGGFDKVHSGELCIGPNTGWMRQTRAEGVGLRARVLSGAHTPSKQASQQARERERERAVGEDATGERDDTSEQAERAESGEHRRRRQQAARGNPEP